MNKIILYILTKNKIILKYIIRIFSGHQYSTYGNISVKNQYCDQHAHVTVKIFVIFVLKLRGAFYNHIFEKQKWQGE